MTIKTVAVAEVTVIPKINSGGLAYSDAPRLT